MAPYHMPEYMLISSHNRTTSETAIGVGITIWLNL